MTAAHHGWRTARVSELGGSDEDGRRARLLLPEAGPQREEKERGLCRHEYAVFAADRDHWRGWRCETADGMDGQAEVAALLMVDRRRALIVGRRVAGRMAEILRDIEPGDGIAARHLRHGRRLRDRQQDLQQNSEHRQPSGWPGCSISAAGDHGGKSISFALGAPVKSQACGFMPLK